MMECNCKQHTLDACSQWATERITEFHVTIGFINDDRCISFPIANFHVIFAIQCNIGNIGMGEVTLHTNHEHVCCRQQFSKSNQQNKTEKLHTQTLNTCSACINEADDIKQISMQMSTILEFGGKTIEIKHIKYSQTTEIFCICCYCMH